tara:strand:- start:4508 stop:4909 length:402 start_codon:yes stop_codon:yes gene_type:complete
MPHNQNPNRILHNHKIRCIDYLLLSILENPGQSQRFHTRRLHQWQHKTEDHHSGGTNIAYFNNKEYYRDILFTDVSQKTIPYYNAIYGELFKSPKSQIHLTITGFNRANKLRIKLGLPEISWESTGHPLSCKL